MPSVHYEDLLSIEKLIEVYEQIKANTHHKKKIVHFEMFFSSNLISLLEELRSYHYQHQGYEVFLIRDPKYRIIMSETMHDKIINHLVSRYALIPLLDKKFIDMNVATRKDMGTKKAIFYFKKYINHLKENHDDIYVLKCDIKKYFYNIDHKILLDKLKKDVQDEHLYKILQTIIDSTDQCDVNSKISKVVQHEKSRIHTFNLKDCHIKDYLLDTLPRYEKGKGLPIGNETSQIFAIYYLNDLDHYIKEKLRIKCYVRYMDDFLLIHPDKEYLKECRKKIEEIVASLNLSLNEKTQIFSMKRGINFLGYRFILKNKRLIILINQQNKKRIKRKLRKLKKKDFNKYQEVVASYKGYFQVAHSKEFMHRLKIK